MTLLFLCAKSALRPEIYAFVNLIHRIPAVINTTVQTETSAMPAGRLPENYA
jgi:hypothetical protein